MSKYFDEHQRDIFVKAFNRAKDKDKCVLTHAKKFAKENHAQGKPPQHQIDTYFGALANLANRSAETHEEWAKWRGVAPNPKYLGRSFDFVVELMEKVDYVGSEKHKRELAEILTNRGGKNFLKSLYDKVALSTKLDIEAETQAQLEILRIREQEVANMMSPITNFSVLKGFDSFHSWKNVVWLKMAYIEMIKREIENATGTIKTALKDIYRRIDILNDLNRLRQHIERNSFADRLLTHYYIGENFEKLEHEHLRLCIGLAYSDIWDYRKATKMQACIFTHNSIFVGDAKDVGNEIVFRKEDAYIDDYHIVYSHKQKDIKKLMKMADIADDDFKKTVKRIEKKIEGRIITYAWNSFYTNSISIDEEWIREQANFMRDEDMQIYEDDKKGYKAFENLYASLNFQSDIVKGLTHQTYRERKKK